MATRNYLAELGEKIIDNGYSIVPIVPGTKQPPEGKDGKDWPSWRVDRPHLKRLLEKGWGNYGVGIITHNAPLVDLDIRDPDVAQHMDDWISVNIAMDAYLRVGQWPKRGIPFRCEGTFAKQLSTIYIDPAQADPNDPRKGQTRVEILGDGQQYVAYAVHPDTGKPYYYTRGGEPVDMRRDELPLLTLDDAKAIIREFERHVESLGWKRYRRGSGGLERAEIDPMRRAMVQRPIDDLTDAQIEETLLLLPARTDYHGWLEVGAALHHQFQGAHAGLELWHKWSERADNYDPNEIERKWPSFGKDGERFNVTFRTIIDAAKEHEQKRIAVAMAEAKKLLQGAQSQEDVQKACREIKKQDFDVLSRNTLVGELRAAVKRITGNNLTIADARRMIRREDMTALERPEWMNHWCFNTLENEFYNWKTREKVSITGFNAAHDRKLLSKLDRLEGKAIPDVHAADLALNVHEVPVVSAVIYLPTEEELFWFNGRRAANGFSPDSIPEMPSKLSSLHRTMIARFQRHLRTIIRNERDRETFLAWYAHTARTMERVRWSVLLQGPEADGKSYFSNLMGAMIGAANVNVVQSDTLRSNFTDYADGGLFATVEEVKLHGLDRLDVLNRLKPLITNQVIEVHPKGGKRFEAPNTKTYLFLTNFVDAIPMGEGDTRYFPIMSAFRSKDMVDEFKAKNPDYYAELDETLEHGPAIRKWLIDEYEPPSWFNPKGRAPESSARGRMIAMQKSDEQTAFEEGLADSLRADFSARLLSVSALKNALMDAGAVLPPPRAISTLLASAGFELLGRHRGLNGERQAWWSREPHLFQRPDGETDPLKIRNYLLENDI